jgi:hypothetical protein
MKSPQPEHESHLKFESRDLADNLLHSQRTISNSDLPSLLQILQRSYRDIWMELRTDASDMMQSLN